MEVGGQKTDNDLMTSSDQEPPAFCQPCSSDGNEIEAEGYCKTCGEYLCGKCFAVHKVPSICRHHVLLDKTSMPALKTTVNKSPRLSLCTLPCPDHTGKVLEYFCPTHNISLCGVCSMMKHKSCDVEYIPELKTAANYKDSTEYKSIISRLQALQEDSDKLIDDTKTAIEEMEDNVNAKIKEMEEFRDEIVARVNQQVKKLRKQAIKEKEVYQSSQQNLAKTVATLKDEIIQSEQKLIALVNESSNLFAAAKKILEQVCGFEKSLEKQQVDNKIPVFSFEKNEDTQRLVTSDGEFGTLEVFYKPRDLHMPSTTNPTLARSLDFTNVGVTRLPDLDMKTKDDKYGPFIKGLAYLHPDTLFAADWNNNKIKVVNMTSNTVTSQLSLLGEPFDITLLPANQEAAVTIPYHNNIQVISTSGQLSCLRSIPVRGNCWGICSTNSSFIVSFGSESKVQVMDFSGNVLTTINTDANGKKLFTHAFYVSIAEEEGDEMILVADASTNTVTKLTMQGKVVSTYKRDTWNGIRVLATVGEKQVLVCNIGGQTVDVVEEDNDNVVTLLDLNTHGIFWPYALCYCPAQGRLYVSSYINQQPILVFDIHANK